MRKFNKKEKTKICRFILNNTTLVVEDKHRYFLMEYIFPFHKDWKEKCGVGIDHIEVRRTTYGNKCFYLVRTDGTETDISFSACITPHSKMDDIQAACRNCVSSTIELFKNSVSIPYTCPITGEVIEDRKKLHIDHYDMTFKEVVDMWMKDRDVDEVYRKTLSSNRDKCLDTYFDDPELIIDFIQFHNRHTHLRAVSRTANLSVLTRKS